MNLSLGLRVCRRLTVEEKILEIFLRLGSLNFDVKV
jgi:hypothetical protein